MDRDRDLKLELSRELKQEVEQEIAEAGAELSMHLNQEIDATVDARMDARMESLAKQGKLSDKELEGLKLAVKQLQGAIERLPHQVAGQAAQGVASSSERLSKVAGSIKQATERLEERTRKASTSKEWWMVLATMLVGVLLGVMLFSWWTSPDKRYQQTHQIGADLLSVYGKQGREGRKLLAGWMKLGDQSESLTHRLEHNLKALSPPLVPEVTSPKPKKQTKKQP